MVKKENVDYVRYMDTDSLFITVGEFLDKYVPSWREMSDDLKIHYVRKVSKIIEEYVNSMAYKEVQRKAYNSAVEDFRVKFKQEVVARNALFIKKKKYGYWSINKEGVAEDKVVVKGLEIIRSDTPEAIRPRLKDVMNMILKNSSDEDLKAKIDSYKKELLNVYPEEIALNIGVQGLDKYLIDGEAIKGTPMHVKAVNNYRKLMKHLNIEGHYEDIHEGIKTKIVYLKKNPLNLESMAFIRWPKEFNSIISIDYQRMISDFFTSKVEILLDPMNKLELLNSSSATVVNAFF